MGFKFNKQIDGRSSDWIGTSFFNRHSFIAKSSLCSTFWLQNWSPAAICRASNLSAKGLNASHASHAQVKSQQQFECSKRAEDCCSLKLKIENCQVRLFQLVPCRESLIAACSGSIPHIALWTKITLETVASLSREALQKTLAILRSSVHWTREQKEKINIYPRAQLVLAAKIRKKCLIEMINFNYQRCNQGVSSSEFNVLTERVLINIRFLRVCTKNMFCGSAEHWCSIKKLRS